MDILLQASVWSGLWNESSGYSIQIKKHLFSLKLLNTRGKHLK